MTCRRCGARCHGRYCKDCGRDEHRNQRLYPEEDNTDTDTLLYDCTGCGGRYRSDSPGDCPHCDHYGARYAGDGAGEPIMTDGGLTVDDYADMGVIHDQKFEQPEDGRPCDAKHCDHPAEFLIRDKGKLKLPGGKGYRCKFCVKRPRRYGYEVVEL